MARVHILQEQISNASAEEIAAALASPKRLTTLRSKLLDLEAGCGFHHECSEDLSRVRHRAKKIGSKLDRQFYVTRKIDGGGYTIVRTK
jgi:hypothetical protein